MRDTARAAVAELAAAFGNRLATGDMVCRQHAQGTTWLPVEAPDAVLWPQETTDVQAAMRICARHRLPVIAYGTGTSLEGQVNAPEGGLCLDFRDMNRVLAINAEDFDCTVEPGVTRGQLNAGLRDTGLFFSVDPGADASLGGMASTRASGTTAVRYGTMRDNVLALTAVGADGTLLTTGRRARKSSAGFDLTRLLVGAEGTLGIITSLTLRVHGIPQVVAAGVCALPTVEACCAVAITAIQAGIPLARIEVLDEVQVAACNRHSRLGLAERPTLFAEFHGSEAAVAEQVAQFGTILADAGGEGFAWASEAEARNRLWKARHDVFWAVRGFRAGAAVVVTDVCVPIGNLAACVAATKRDLVASGLVAPIVGHAGDGNFHCSLLVMMDDTDEVARARAFIDRLAERALAMDGTCTGEHGIGQGKRHFLEAELGPGAVAAMRAVKRSLDPLGILNPGKIL
ncbi:MAG: FAD-linked oxidase C-terminal domain-containing protein [Geminicoccaceae bacterium]